VSEKIGTTSHRRLADERAQVGSWLVKVIIWVGLVGFLVIEFGSVLVNRVQAQDLASEAAVEANLMDDRSPRLETARARAEEFVGDKAEVLEVSVDRAAGTLSVTLRKQARTFVVHRIEALEGLATVTVTESVPLRGP
jgi:hypothetical protein